MKAIAYVLALAVIVAAFAASADAQAPVGCRPSPSWPAARRQLAQQVFVLVNQHRRSLGLAPLRTTTRLRQLATWKARNMAATRYFSHDDPHRTVWERFAACRVTGGWRGENIAYGYQDARAVVQGWLGSPGHRANIENPNFHYTGVAAAGVSVPYYAQDFRS